MKREKERALTEMDYSKFDFHYDIKDYEIRLPKGLNEKTVREISRIKHEPEWMTELRVKAFNHFLQRPMPAWGPDLSEINFDEITYYLAPRTRTEDNWEDVPDYVKKTFDRLGIPEAEKKFLGGAGAQMDCLTADTIVLTNPKGPVKIVDVKPGDTIFSLNEKTKKIETARVKNIWCAGTKPVFNVKIKNREVKASDNHPFLALTYKRSPDKKRGRYKPEWVPLKELKEGDLIALAKSYPDKGKSAKLKIPNINMNIIRRTPSGKTYSLNVSHSYNKVSLPAESNEDFMWLVGFFLGDGYIKNEKNKSKKRVNFAIPQEQVELRKELARVAKQLFDYDLKSYYRYYVAINSTIIAKFFEENGFSGKAKTKKVPEWVFSLPKSQILFFLAGYIDADGGVRDHVKNHDITLTSANKKLLESMKKLAMYCGIESSTIWNFTSKIGRKQYELFRCMLSGNTEQIQCRHPIKAERILKKAYYHSYSTAKGTVFRKYCNEFIGFAKIDKITPAGKELTYDIEVDGFHNFVANGIIVHNSEVVYHKIREDLEKQGVVFLSMDDGLKQYPEIVKKYFGKIIPFNDNKFAALNTATWSGGSFVYIPKNTKVNIPLQAYFRINAEKMGQFERTLIIAEENSQVSYFEACTAPKYSSKSLHAAVVELVALPGAHIRYTTIQNWSNNIYNLVTKRAFAYKNASVEWLDCNFGSKVTQKYPSVYMLGEGSKAEVLSIALAGKGQHQDAGAKAVHVASNTTSRITSKSISKDGGRTSYRGLVKVHKNAKNVKSSVRCDALLLDEKSRSDTYPYIEIDEPSATIAHEASVGKIGDDQLFYLMSRGLTQEQALTLIVLGFIQPFTKQLPMEYAIEMNRLIEMEMEDSVG